MQIQPGQSNHGTYSPQKTTSWPQAVPREKQIFHFCRGGAGEGYVEQPTLAQPSTAKVLELAQEILQMPVRAEDWAAPQLGKIAGLFVFLYGSWHLHNWLGWRGHGMGGASGAAGSMPAQLQRGLASDPA